MVSLCCCCLARVGEGQGHPDGGGCRAGAPRALSSRALRPLPALGPRLPRPADASTPTPGLPATGRETRGRTAPAPPDSGCDGPARGCSPRARLAGKPWSGQVPGCPRSIRIPGVRPGRLTPGVLLRSVHTHPSLLTQPPGRGCWWGRFRGALGHTCCAEQPPTPLASPSERHLSQD